MEDQSLVQQSPVAGGNSLLITAPHSQKPNRNSQGDLELANKSAAIVDNIGALAAAYDHPLTAEGIDAYARALMDLSPDELHHGFNRAIRELKFWPRPSELREMCTGCAAAMTDKLRIDAAWNWIHQYITMFGVPAKARWLIQGQAYNGRSPEIPVRNSKK